MDTLSNTKSNDRGRRLAARTAGLLIPFVSILFVLSTDGNPAFAQASDSLWQIGYIPQNAVVHHVFWMRNPGNAPLGIARIETSCSCTSAAIPDSTIAPGDSLALTVRFESKVLLHTVRKTVTVRMIDPAIPVTRFHLQAYVLGENEPTGIYRVSPVRLSWTPGDDRDTESRDSIRVKNLGGDSVNVRVRTCCQDCLSANPLDITLAGGKAEWIRLRGQQGTADTSCRHGAVALIFGDAEQTVITVPIDSSPPDD